MRLLFSFMDERAADQWFLAPGRIAMRPWNRMTIDRFLFVIVFGLALTTGQAQGEDSTLRNGYFVNVWKLQDNPMNQDVPMYWFTSENASVEDAWVKVMEGLETGVELTPGEEPRWLFQDVRIDPTQTLILKWKVKGSGAASVSAYSRDDEGNIFPATSKVTQVNEEFQEDEVFIAAPPEATILRIMIGPDGSNSKVQFESVELISSTE